MASMVEHDSGATGAESTSPAPLTVTEWWDSEIRGGDPLQFPAYADALNRTADESVRTGLATIGGRSVALIESRYENFGGTMGAAAGEKIARAFLRATELKVPVVALTSTGGARLQEGMVALIQMGRTTSARCAHAAAGLLTAAVFRSPTTGGVYASWGSLADIRAASAGAVLGFGGPRVVQQVTGQLPPPISHTAESAYAGGLVDAVVGARDEVPWLEAVLGVGAEPLGLAGRRPAVTAPLSAAPTPETPGAENGAGWRTLLTARGRRRPSGLEWAAALCSSWVDLHGTDPVIRAGLATIGGRRAVVIAMDRHARADGAARPGPDGYRLAQRAVALADQLRLPILTLVDTPGAEPGPVGSRQARDEVALADPLRPLMLTLVDTPGAEPGPKAEFGGIAGEIARTLRSVSQARGVTVSLCAGEGGSGGALALAYTDRMFMLAGAVFSVIGPEAAATVLLRDASRAPAMADALRITGPELRSLGIVAGLLPDAGPGAVDVVGDAVLEAFDCDAPGDRDVRSDRATQPWLRTAR